jgi:hypothetical protein
MPEDLYGLIFHRLYVAHRPQLTRRGEMIYVRFEISKKDCHVKMCFFIRNVFENSFAIPQKTQFHPVIV